MREARVVEQEGLSQNARDAIDAIALTFREPGQSTVAAGAALAAGGEYSRGVAELAVQESDIRLLAQYLGLDRLPPDSQIRTWRNDMRMETTIQIAQPTDDGIEITERVIPDELMYRFRGVRPRLEPVRRLGSPCNCPCCRLERERHREREDEYRRWEPDPIELEANSRARSLLLSCLSPSQRVEFSVDSSFTIVSPSGRRYRVEQGRNYNIGVLGERGSRVIGRLCAGPTGNVPTYDCMLAQKLWLENDEEGFLKVANKSGFVDDPEPIWGEVIRF